MRVADYIWKFLADKGVRHCFLVVGDLANTDTIMNSSLWIGLCPGMGDAKLDYMIATIREFCNSR